MTSVHDHTGTALTVGVITPLTRMGSGKWTVQAVVSITDEPMAAARFQPGRGKGEIAVTFRPDEAEAFAQAILAAVRPQKLCLYCNNAIPDRKTGRPAKFCSASCRAAYWREWQESAAHDDNPQPDSR